MIDQEDAAQGVELLEKNKPQQQRAVKTYEAILSATGELLCEVGLERISTNNIAERAGVTVPALYRYFPNKYAVLNALGARLMDAQNDAFVHWHQTYVEGKSAQHMLESLYNLLFETYEVTRDFRGGLEIMHGMQAMAPLQEVRLDSHWAIADGFGRIWADQFKVPYTAETARHARLAVEIGFMALQMALEDSRLDADQALRDGAQALRVYLEFTTRDAGVNLEQS
ncbi:MAG: TetR/AcrR family transcriptional regulator [Halieaceae bacterium]